MVQERLNFQPLPDLQLKIPVRAELFEIRAIGCHKPRPVRSGRERDEHVEVQVAKLVRREALVRPHLAEYQTRIEPIRFRWSQDGMIAFQSAQKIPLCAAGHSTPKLGQYDPRRPDDACDLLHSVAGGCPSSNHRPGRTCRK
jgi:hypothetical protein